MPGARNDTRVLIYSHDSFGLGHLRRCRAIAHSLVENHKNLSVLILIRLADHRQLRFSRTGGFRPCAWGHKAPQRRIYLP